jgi:hypothetical protein
MDESYASSKWLAENAKKLQVSLYKTKEMRRVMVKRTLKHAMNPCWTWDLLSNFGRNSFGGNI